MKRTICGNCYDGFFMDDVVDCDVCDTSICESCVTEHYENEHAEELLASDDGPDVFAMTKKKVDKLKGLEEGEEDSEDDSYGEGYDEDDWDYLSGTEQEL